MAQSCNKLEDKKCKEDCAALIIYPDSERLSL